MATSVSKQSQQNDATEPLLEDTEAFDLQNFSLEHGYRHDAPSKRHHGFRRILSNLTSWASGPRRRRQLVVKPLFQSNQKALLELIDTYLPTPFFKAAALAAICFLWLFGFSYLVARSTSSPRIPGFGSPKRLSCISTPWPNNGDGCGLDGIDCLPFENASFAFRCPPDCGRVKVSDERVVGSQSILYRHFVIGGPKDSSPLGYSEGSYRGDSQICLAAIHAGVIENSRGGCGIFTLLGEKASYSGTERHGIASIGFDSSFPMSFAVKAIEGQNNACIDLNWIVLALSVTVTVIISLATASPAVFYFCTFTIIFFQVALLSDAPDFEDYLSVVQSGLSRFLPAMFIAIVVFILCVQKSLHGLEAQLEKTILWLGGCWFGALENYTLDRLPLQRLTPRDFAQSGALAVLIVLIGLLTIATVIQAWSLWIEGRLPRYVALYTILACCLSVLSQLPGLNLRIHHYILALLLLPGTAIQSKLSLLFQGFLVGLFINGVARWGFASILETDVSLARLGPMGTPFPAVPVPTIQGSNISFNFAELSEEWDGISIRVNDVERFRWFQTDGHPSLSWTRSKDEPLYFRFGYLRIGFIEGILQGDYTKAGMWARNNSWIFTSA